MRIKVFRKAPILICRPIYRI